MGPSDGDVGRTRVLIVDDHRMFVESLVRLLEDEPDLVVSGLAHTIAEATDLLSSVVPDVILLDYRLPDGDAPSCIPRLRRLLPGVRVLVMTGLTDEATLAAARAAGTDGVVTKDRAASELVEGIRVIARGATLDDSAAEPMRPRRTPDPSAQRALSVREREVLTQLATGKTTEDIASELGIGVVTVRNHIQRILAKLGAHSRLEAVATGIQRGVIAPPRRGPDGN